MSVPKKRIEGPTEAEMENWPNRQEASRMLGKSVLTIIRMQRRGELNPVLVKKVWRYDPEELKGSESTIDEMDPAAIVAAAGEAFAQVSKHNLDLHDKVVAVMDREHATHTLLATENERLRKRIAELEAKQVEMIEAYSEMMQEVHDREMDRMRTEASEKRKERAVEMFLKLAPAAIAGWMKDRVGSELADVVLEISDADFEAVCMAGVIPPDKINVLRRVRQTLKDAAKGRENDAHHSNERRDVSSVPAEQGGVPQGG